MNPVQFPRLFVVAAVATLIIATPSEAQRRRTVRHPTAKVAIAASEVTGTILDNATGKPVVNARVAAGGKSDTTDAQGKFRIRNLTGFGSFTLQVSRSGYATRTVPLTLADKQDVTVRLEPGLTARVRKVDGTTYDYDFDSIRFGFAVVFSGYQGGESDDFCKPDGTAVTLDRSEFKRITGPATLVTHAPCCTTSYPLLKINAELKSGEITDLYFKDACDGYANVDLSGRAHVSGEVMYTLFTDIAEVTFP